MRPHPRIRKTIKWSGAAVTTLLIVFWLSSGWCSAIWQTPSRRYRLTLQSGRVGLAEVYAQQDTSARGWHFSVQPPSFDWTWARHKGRNFDAAWVPIWAPTLATLLVSTVAWCLDTLARRRANLNLCPHCHYNRATLTPTTLCPECGKLPA